MTLIFIKSYIFKVLSFQYIINIQINHVVYFLHTKSLKYNVHFTLIALLRGTKFSLEILDFYIGAKVIVISNHEFY